MRSGPWPSVDAGAHPLHRPPRTRARRSIRTVQRRRPLHPHELKPARRLELNRFSGYRSDPATENRLPPTQRLGEPGDRLKQRSGPSARGARKHCPAGEPWS